MNRTRPFLSCAACIRRPVAKENSGRVRISAAVGAGQPSLTFEEFEHRMNQMIYVSATPGSV